MNFNDTPYGSAWPRVIRSPFVPERPAMPGLEISTLETKLSDRGW